ncbi:MAG TPA: tRNA (adenosine(37)-N6)-threonylcarbamoyltransferase complex transferase subunit TsaD [Chitinophagaceae bacterium]|nr:tRNA (adenosine(37)-N6)-threonylcarbamoyltransferase complex transferase subunit TsaD [Chitinophagaceae bacterium]
MKQTITLLAIESSCDETAASVIVDGKILSNFIANQTVHEKFGGVVPELASRAHMENIVPVVDASLQKAFPELTRNEQLAQLNAIAFTQAPGLIGSLLVGAQFAKSMALALNIPLIAVHHMQAHVLANLIDDPKPNYPFLCLTVSGGHTQIVKCNSASEMHILGETIDDAAGEAFDKISKLLGLPYPGGPVLDKLAQLGNPKAFVFAKPQVPNLDFSFSGLKTSVLYFLQKQSPEFIQENLNDLCASVQFTIIEILLKKLKKAMQETGIKEVCIAGGVSANSGLRKAMEQLGKDTNSATFLPKFEYCTDNAAMIAITAHFKYIAGSFEPLTTSASARSSWA